MKYITHKVATGGRSGHKLKDIFSTYMFSFLIENLNVIPHRLWENQKILNFPNTQTEGQLNKSKFSAIIDIYPDEAYWDGMPFDSTQQIIKKIKESKDNSLLKLNGVARIHPHQLSDWFDQGLIKNDIFINQFIPLIRNLYYQDKTPIQKNQLAIHARRGDLRGWPVEYFISQINSFRREHPNVPIKVFSENENSEDLLKLKKFKKLELHLGGVGELGDHILEMVSSNFFMPCNSSLSTWAAYICQGKIIMPDPKMKIKHFHKEHIW